MLCKPPLRRKRMFKRCQMIICALVLLFAVLGLTSTVSTEPNVAGRLRTRVFLKFTLTDGRLIKVVAFVGSKINIQIQERTYHLTPSISNSDNGVVELAIAGSSLERRGVDGEQLVRLKFENESSDSTPINSDLSVRLLRVERVVKSPKQANPDERPGRQAGSIHPLDVYDAGEGVCCVSCDGVTACSSCLVEVVGCGYCCGNDCPDCVMFPD